MSYRNSDGEEVGLRNAGLLEPTDAAVSRRGFIEFSPCESFKTGSCIVTCSRLIYIVVAAPERWHRVGGIATKKFRMSGPVKIYCPLFRLVATQPAIPWVLGQARPEFFTGGRLTLRRYILYFLF